MCFKKKNERNKCSCGNISLCLNSAKTLQRSRQQYPHDLVFLARILGCEEVACGDLWDNLSPQPSLMDVHNLHEACGYSYYG